MSCPNWGLAIRCCVQIWGFQVPIWRSDDRHAGLGAALPAVSNVQSECFSHLSRTLHDILSGKHRNCTGISFSADAFTSVTEEKQGKIRTTTKQKMIECVRVRIDEARFSTCRQLSLFILENLVDTLNLGGIPGYPFPQVSNQLL